MYFFSTSYFQSNGSLCSLCISLAILFNYAVVGAFDQLLLCAELQSESQCVPSWDYCVDERPARRNWYEAMSACRSFGGELVALESPEKIEHIQDRLSGRGVNLSNGVFVNANRPFYSASDQFAWRSGIPLQLEADIDYMEQCVQYSSTGLLQITCDSDFQVFPLVCQRVFSRQRDTAELQQLLLSDHRNLNVSYTSISYAAESCDYFSFVRFNYNWYQARKLCESINFELLGIPRIEECPLIDECTNLPIKLQYPEFILNTHVKIFARNGSFEIFRDPSGKTFNESNCGFKFDSTTEDYCVVVKQNRILSRIKCKDIDPSGLKAFICKLCLPNSYSYSYEKACFYNNSASPHQQFNNSASPHQQFNNSPLPESLDQSFTFFWFIVSMLGSSFIGLSIGFFYMYFYDMRYVPERHRAVLHRWEEFLHWFSRSDETNHLPSNATVHYTGTLDEASNILGQQVRTPNDSADEVSSKSGSSGTSSTASIRFSSPLVYVAGTLERV